VKRILVVDDEPTILAAVATRLRAEEFLVETAVDGPSAVATAAATEPDLVVLDVMLPGFDGLEVCRRIQALRSTPVLMLTARSDETDMLVGLGIGADDYLTKPFSMRELVARVRVLLRRMDRAGDATPLSFGDYRIDLQARRVHRADEEIHLTRIEFDLLVFLAGRPRAAVARETLLEHVWGWASDVETRTVDSLLVAGVVALLGVAALNPERLIAERNIDRYEQTGLMDTDYLLDLSTDVEPALRRLPEPIRLCARYRDEAPGAWYEFNFSRSRANHDGTVPVDGCYQYWDPDYSGS